MYERRGRPGWRLAGVVVLVLAWALVVAFVAQPFVVPSRSMAPTLEPGDRILVSKVSAREAVDRGEIIVFRDPGGWLRQRPPSSSAVGRAARQVAGAVGIVSSDDAVLVKRVIGIGGDRVRCCDGAGRVTVNEVAVDESAYLSPYDVPSQVSFEVTVPFGHVWVMGDHRSDSADSRFHRDDSSLGAVDEDLIIGRAVAVLWPVTRAGPLPVPASLQGLPSSGA